MREKRPINRRLFSLNLDLQHQLLLDKLLVLLRCMLTRLFNTSHDFIQQ